MTDEGSFCAHRTRPDNSPHLDQTQRDLGEFFWGLDVNEMANTVPLDIVGVRGIALNRLAVGLGACFDRTKQS